MVPRHQVRAPRGQVSVDGANEAIRGHTERIPDQSRRLLQHELSSSERIKVNLEENYRSS